MNRGNIVEKSNSRIGNNANNNNKSSAPTLLVDASFFNEAMEEFMTEPMSILDGFNPTERQLITNNAMKNNYEDDDSESDSGSDDQDGDSDFDDVDEGDIGESGPRKRHHRSDDEIGSATIGSSSEEAGSEDVVDGKTYNHNENKKRNRSKRKYQLSAVARERRNRRRRLYSVLPRGLKTDIRRHYIHIFMNALNSFDNEFLFNALTKFCTPNCVMVNFIPGITIHGFSPIVQFQNHRYITEYWLMNGRYVPDLMCRATETQLRLPFDSPHSKLVANVKFVGTQVFLPPSHMVDQIISRLVHVEQHKLISREDGVSFETPELNRYLQFDSDWLSQKTSNLPTPMPTPIPVNLEACVTFCMDENNYIYRMDFIGSEVNKEVLDVKKKQLTYQHPCLYRYE